MTEESKETKVVEYAPIRMELPEGVDPPPIEELLLFTVDDDPTTYTPKQLEDKFGYRVSFGTWRRVPENNAFDDNEDTEDD